jgi:SRSO17 transposase
MTGASIETTLELWACSLREVKGRMRGLFTQERVAASANLFLDGLLGDERRKTGWMRAEAAGDPGPWRQQAILGRGRWDADGLRDIVRDYVVENLATDDAVVVMRPEACRPKSRSGGLIEGALLTLAAVARNGSLSQCGLQKETYRSVV